MRFLVKCPKCGETENITSIRKVLMDSNSSMDDWTDPAIDAAYCTRCKVEIGIGHIVTVSDDDYLEVDITKLAMVE